MTLPPGGGSLLYVAFDPNQASGPDVQDELVVDTDARNVAYGELRIPLIGFAGPSEQHPGRYPHETIQHEQ